QSPVYEQKPRGLAASGLGHQDEKRNFSVILAATISLFMPSLSVFLPSFPASRFKLVAAVFTHPAFRDPVVSWTLSHPMARNPDMPAALPAPISRRPYISGTRWWNHFCARTRRGYLDIDIDPYCRNCRCSDYHQ